MRAWYKMSNCRESLHWKKTPHIFRTFFSKETFNRYCRYLAFQIAMLLGIHLSTSVGTYSKFNAHKVDVEQHWDKTIAVQFSCPVHPLRNPWALHADVCVNAPHIPALYQYWLNSERPALLFSQAKHRVKIQCFNHDWIDILQDSYWSLNAAGDPTSASKILRHNQYENRCYIFIDIKPLPSAYVCGWMSVCKKRRQISGIFRASLWLRCWVLWKPC